MRTTTLCLCLSLPLISLAGDAMAHAAKRRPVVPAFVPASRAIDATAVSSALDDLPVRPSGMIMSFPAPATSSAPELRPLDRIAAANKAAIQEPRTDGYINAIQIYPYLEGYIFRLYAAPDRVTDISLQGGEQLIAISAGDTTRWIIGNTHSGAGADQKVHILVKPQVSGLKTNLVIATDRRTYHLQMESTPATAMAALSWRYPQDELLAIQAAAKISEAGAPAADGVALDRVNFSYAITGANPAWRPLRAFDDGARVYIQFPAGMKTSEAPPLFIVGKGGKAQLVNYRLSRDYYIVDGLFDVAELRLGETPQVIVRITARPGKVVRHD
jgi:type IV secretion system protein VirB9